MLAGGAVTAAGQAEEVDVWIIVKRGSLQHQRQRIPARTKATHCTAGSHKEGRLVQIGQALRQEVL